MYNVDCSKGPAQGGKGVGPGYIWDTVAAQCVACPAGSFQNFTNPDYRTICDDW